jgi:CelD/BcsL family acetyltransferase involved in cellulose biosynthesis
MAAVAAAIRIGESRVEARVVDDAAGFDRLRGDWDRLADEMQPSSPMLGWDWCRTWWNYFGGRGRLCILTFASGGQVIGIAPFHEQRVGFGALALRVLKPIGWEDYGNQGMTESLELLFPPARRAALMVELASWLGSSRVASVWLPSINVEETLPAWLAGRIVEVQPWVQFHHRSLSTDWLDFVQKLNKSMRSNARFYPKRLLRHGHSFELQVADTPAEVSRVLPEAIRLHRTRASTDHVSQVKHWDHFYRDDRAAFLQELAPLLAARGEFKVGVLRIDGDIVAAQMWMERSKTMSMYYSGFLPEWAPYGVQLVTTLEVLKHAMARGVEHVEFLRGGGQVKERWDTDVRRVRNVRFASSRSVGLAIPVANEALLRMRRVSSAIRLGKR